MSELLSASQQLYFKILQDLHQCWTPHPKQIMTLEPLIAGRVDTVFLQCGRKFGKMLDLNTPVFTPNHGYKALGDLSVGDPIYDEKGQVQTVAWLSPVDLRPDSYLITFSNGEKIKACADHRWLTYTKGDYFKEHRDRPFESTIKTTAEIANSIYAGGYYNHKIAAIDPVELPDQKLPVDPYVVGAWLASKNKQNIALVRKIMQADFAFIGIENRDHIPDQYLHGSINQRLALLQGLMDVGGGTSGYGATCIFYTKVKKIADAAHHVVASLGMIPTTTVKKGRFTVQFRPRFAVFRDVKKWSRVKQSPFKRHYHTIVNAVPCEPVPMRCIAVSGDSHLYTVTPSFIATHNTEIAAYFLWRIGLLFPGSALYYVCQEAQHGREIIWRNRRLQNFGPQKYVHKTLDNEMVLYWKNGSFIKIVGSENFAAADGLTPHAVAYDEFKSFRPQFHTAMEPNRLVKKAPLLILGTPPETYAPNYFQYIEYAEECRQSPTKCWFNFSSYDNPFIDKKLIDQKKEEYIRRGEYDVFEREYMGRLIAGGKKAIFPMLTSDHVKKHEDIFSEIKRDLKKLDWYVTVDPGNTTCAAVLFTAINPYTKKIYILDEIYETLQLNTSVGSLVPRIMRKFAELHPNGSFEVDAVKTYDEAAAWFATETMDQFGIHFQQTQKEQNKKENGLSLIKDCLLYKSISISDRCTSLYQEMNMYSLDEAGRIPKKNDHLIDCLRYTLAAAYYTVKEVQEYVQLEERIKRGQTYEQDLQTAVNKDWTNNIGGLDYDFY